jgi:lipopolysaccharide export system permease protein
LPDASEKYWGFRYEYLKKNGQERQTSDIFRQVKPNEFMYVSSYNGISKTGFDFIYEKFNGNKLEYKLYANRVKYNEKTKDYTLFNYVKRTIGKENDIIERQEKLIRKFEFEPDDLTPVIYVAETMNIFNLVHFIDKERSKGSSNLDVYLVVLYKKFSTPVSAFILTIIAVSVSAMKRRGGMGINLAIGILVAFSFVFFDKIFGTLAESSSIPPFLAVWFPNFIFGILAFYLLRNARR